MRYPFEGVQTRLGGLGHSLPKDRVERREPIFVLDVLNFRHQRLTFMEDTGM